MSNFQANQEKAAQLFRDAANLGDPEAQFQYGICLRDGNGVPQSLQEATKWFQKAANAGHREASRALSLCQKPDSSASPPNTPTIANEEKGIGLAIIVGFLAFIILRVVCTEETSGFFGEPEFSENWPVIIIGAGVAAFIAYYVGKNSGSSR